MNVPQEAIDLAKRFEGLRLKPYICPGGYWTIGYGHRCSKNHKDITTVEAEEYLKEDLNAAALGVIRCTIGDMTPIQLAAITDFVFNLGIGNYMGSTLRKAIDLGDWKQAKVQLMKWVYAKGKVLPGLVKRRLAEVALIERGEEEDAK